MSATHTYSCDSGLAHGQACEGATRRPRLVLATSILASSLAFVDGSVVNVGLPAIGRSLGAGAADLQWVINAYLLPLSALLLLGGALGDAFGRRRLLLWGVLLFGLGSVGAAAAPDLTLLLAARGLQGIGAALTLPNSLAVLGASFEGPARGRAVGAWAAASAMSSAIGPVLGGWLIDTTGWRAIFLINLPLCAGTIGLALLSLRDPRPERPPRLDWPGAILATAALGLLTWGLTSMTGPGGATLAAAVALIAGLVLAGLFARNELARGDEAMTPPALFGSRQLMGLNLMTLLLYGALAGFILLVPYVLIQAGGYRATAAGAALAPFPVIMAVGAPAMGALAGRVSPRWPLGVGALIVAAGLLLALRIHGQGSYVRDVLPTVLVVSAGMAGVAAPLTNAVLSSVGDRHTGSASGLNSAVARAGGLTATALMGQVLAASGPQLMGAFHASLVAASACAAAAGAIAFLALGRRGLPPPAA
jgi:EmrB/QacA subfamily drug resistance transporter